MLTLSAVQQNQTKIWKSRCRGYDYNLRKMCATNCVRCEEQKRFQSFAASYVGSFGNESG